jgi:hypothetical protein
MVFFSFTLTALADQVWGDAVEATGHDITLDVQTGDHWSTDLGVYISQQGGVQKAVTFPVVGTISASPGVALNVNSWSVGSYSVRDTVTASKTETIAGTHVYNVTFTATNNIDPLSKKADTVIITVNVTDPAPPADTTNPEFTFVPSPVTAEATDTLTAVGISQATATDNSGSVQVTNNAPVAYPLGDTIVTWTATDPSGNFVQAAQKITIVDTTKPVFTYVPGPITVLLGQQVDIGEATATDIFLASVTNDAPATFPLGAKTVTWTATDTS